jgi:hypothetical protein
MIRWFVSLNRNICQGMQRAFPNFFDDPSCIEAMTENIRDVMERDHPKVILEVGGVDRPLLPRSKEYTFCGVDIDNRPECVELYDQFVVQSVEDPMPVKADMILSVTLLEHVPNNAKAARSMFLSLNPGGTTHHYVPCKWHPYAICLRIVGPQAQRWLIKVLRPAAVEVSGYPAFFNYCTPMAMKRLFEKSGFVDVKVQPFYRATDYFAFFVPAFLVVAAFENLCRGLRLSTFSSGFVIRAKKD